MSMKRSFTLFLLLFCAALVLTACGSNIVEAQNAAPFRFMVESADTFQFAPDKVSIPAESRVVLTFRNVGNLEHNFIVAAGEIDPFNLHMTDALAEINTGIVPGGEEATLTFKAPPPGAYTFVCVVPGHAAAGMRGTLTVVEP